MNYVEMGVENLIYQ